MKLKYKGIKIKKSTIHSMLLNISTTNLNAPDCILAEIFRRWKRYLDKESRGKK